MKTKTLTNVMLAGCLALATCEVIAQVLTEHEAMAREMFADVIAMDTSVTKRETPRMASYLAQRFREAGFADENVTEVPIEEDIVALLVRYPGRDRGLKGVGLLAHMDVVTAFRKDWELDPFTLTERGGYFIGRGTVDNKAGVVGLASTFIQLKQQGYVPERDLVLMLTADEETGMLSARHFARELRDTINVEYVINADALSGVLAPNGAPMGYYIQGAEKTYQSWRFTVRNPGGHSSAPRDDNAIYQLAEALLKVRAFRFPVMLNEISVGMLEAAAAVSDQPTVRAIEALIANPKDAAAAEVVGQHPLLSTVIRTTCVATMLEGGHAENALPQSASATVNCRIMPGVHPEEIYETLARVVDDGEVEMTPLQAGGMAPASPMREDIVAAVGEAIQEYPGVRLIPFMASYGTDGKEYRSVGIPVYGSSGSFMNPQEAYAHGLNEKIPVETFYASLGYWQRLMKILAANPPR